MHDADPATKRAFGVVVEQLTAEPPVLHPPAVQETSADVLPQAQLETGLSKLPAHIERRVCNAAFALAQHVALVGLGEQEKALCKHLAEQIGSDEYSARVGVGSVRAAVEAYGRAE